MTFKTSLISAVFLAGVALLALAIPANSQEAEVTADLNMRMGPGTRYPVIETIPDGRIVRVYGCVSGYDWCDVRWRRTRGWVFADYLRYRFDGRWRMLPDWGARIDLPIVSFSIGDYAHRHYRGTRYYNRLRRWARDRDIEFRFRFGDDDFDRDRRWRDRDRDRDWERDRDCEPGDTDCPGRDQRSGDSTDNNIDDSRAGDAGRNRTGSTSSSDDATGDDDMSSGDVTIGGGNASSRATVGNENASDNARLGRENADENARGRSGNAQRGNAGRGAPEDDEEEWPRPGQN